MDLSTYTEGYDDAVQDLDEMGLEFVEAMVFAFDLFGHEFSAYALGYGTALNVHKERRAR